MMSGESTTGQQRDRKFLSIHGWFEPDTRATFKALKEVYLPIKLCLAELNGWQRTIQFNQPGIIISRSVLFKQLFRRKQKKKKIGRCGKKKLLPALKIRRGMRLCAKSHHAPFTRVHSRDMSPMCPHSLTLWDVLLLASHLLFTSFPAQLFFLLSQKAGVYVVKLAQFWCNTLFSIYHGWFSTKVVKFCLQ